MSNVSQDAGSSSGLPETTSGEQNSELQSEARTSSTDGESVHAALATCAAVVLDYVNILSCNFVCVRALLC